LNYVTENVVQNMTKATVFNKKAFVHPLFVRYQFRLGNARGLDLKSIE